MTETKRADTIKDMVEKGLTLKEIADKFGVSKQAVSSFCGRNGIAIDPKYIAEDAAEKQSKAKAGGSLVKPTAMIGVPVTQAEAQALLAIDPAGLPDTNHGAALETIQGRIRTRAWRFPGNPAGA